MHRTNYKASYYCIRLYFRGVNFRGFRGHLVIRENNIFVNPQNFLLCESTKISAVQLQPFLHNDFKVLPYSLPCA